jgi:hypothetical protein
MTGWNAVRVVGFLSQYNLVDETPDAGRPLGKPGHTDAAEVTLQALQQ